MFWLICNPNIFLSLSRPSPSPPPHWCGRQGTQGRCLTEPWMLFSCHTFPKRLAAAPIVAAEGGLLSWFFGPPAVALVSDGFIERECGPNNGRHHDIMLLMRAKSSCRYMIGFHRMEETGKDVHKDISDMPVGQFFFLVFRGTKINVHLLNTLKYNWGSEMK